MAYNDKEPPKHGHAWQSPSGSQLFDDDGARNLEHDVGRKEDQDNDRLLVYAAWLALRMLEAGRVSRDLHIVFQQ